MDHHMETSGLVGQGDYDQWERGEKRRLHLWGVGVGLENTNGLKQPALGISKHSNRSTYTMVWEDQIIQDTKCHKSNS